MKLYVGTYKKYAEGNIFGSWLDLDDYSSAEEFLAACHELHCDEHDPEFMFQDYEADFGWEEPLYSECSVPCEYWQIKDELKRTSLDEDVFSAYVAYVSTPLSARLVDECQEAFLGKYDSLKDYAMDFCQESGLFEDADQTLVDYFDYEAYARDLELSGRIFIHNGCVFQSR